MAQVTDILQSVAILLGQSNVSALTINSYNIGLLALNQARQYAERSHDFKYSETNCFLSIGSTGGVLTNAYGSSAGAVVTVLSAPTPDVTGTYVQQGFFNGYPFYMLIAATPYVLWFNLGTWMISTVEDFGAGSTTDAFDFVSTSINPSGTYTGTGAYTGSVTVVASPLSIKRVKYVSLPISGGYEVIEFLTNDQFLNRVRIQTGRQPFQPTKSLNNLGASGVVNPVCYQNSNVLYLAGNGIAFPTVAQLNVVQWQPDYTANTDSDFFTQYGSEFLMWQTAIIINKNYKWLTVRQEGGLEEDKADAMRDAALQSLINWDLGIEQGTSERPQPPNPNAR